MGSSSAMVPRPLVTAHTGCEGTAENSLDSIVAGVEAGADAVEIDVRATADGVGVLLHDPEISVHGHGTVAVSDLSIGDLRRVEATQRRETRVVTEPVVLLEDALALARDYTTIINLDVKEDSSIPTIIRAVKNFRLTDQVVLSGCSRERAAAVTAAHPGLRVLLNTERLDSCAGDGDYHEFAMQTYHDAVRAGCCGINIDHQLCRDPLVTFAHQRFLPVSVWTVNTPEEMRRVTALGVFAITTYEPRLLLRLLQAAA